jgi:hypothetical protein
MALYADENFPLRVVEELRRLGHDVLTAFEDGRANQSILDSDLLARATAIDRALLTLNRIDFKRLHRPRRNHHLYGRSGSRRASSSHHSRD